MARNIVVFSDGTGQRGGVLFEERRSNIYKLYRAARSAPDSSVSAADQFAYYDPGVGTLPSGLGPIPGIARWLYNLVCQATGLGLTGNIIDCYAQIIRHWRPGDRIFLFGFSRGAYTARCVAAVLAHCGVPTRMKDGSPLRRDEKSCRRIAREAVTKVYQHVSSKKDTAYYNQRKALAARFRAQYGSGDAARSNAYPYFIGVFDTVAALSNTGSLIICGVIGTALLLLLAAIGTLWAVPFWRTAGAILAAATVLGLAALVKTHLKVAFGLPGIPWWKTLHLTSFRMRFYDEMLDLNVGWARHALAIDEHRADFRRVPWGNTRERRETQAGEPEWLQQIWFAGCHSDIGGSYPECESRLSDISLGWMIEQVKALPAPLLLDESVLRLHPDHAGIQHDETRSLAFRFAKRALREVPENAPLHASVIARFEVEAVQHHDLDQPYRPRNLRGHEATGWAYGAGRREESAPRSLPMG